MDGLKQDDIQRLANYKNYLDLVKKYIMGTRMSFPSTGMTALNAKFEDEKISYFTNEEEEGTEKFVDNTPIGIIPNSLAELITIQIGDPWIDSKMHVNANQFEKEVIQVLTRFFEVEADGLRGYVATGGTEANQACLWWSKRYFLEKSSEALEEIKKINGSEIEVLRAKIREMEIKKPILYCTTKHSHYCIHKICELQNIQLSEVQANEKGEMDLENFREQINKHVKEYPHRNIIVSANYGTTFYGAMDDIRSIKSILDEITNKGQISNFSIHVDGALLGILMPLLVKKNGINSIFDELGINTIAMSGHKILGTVVCGIALIKKDVFNTFNHKSIEYAGNIRDSTISGSRASLSVLSVHNALYTLKLNENNYLMQNILEMNFNNADYLYRKLVEKLGEENVYKNNFTVIFKKPSENVIKKFFLMVIGEKASITVLQHLNKKKIDNFISELDEIIEDQ